MSAMVNGVEVPPLTHRFTALYDNGEAFYQPQDDKPITPRPDGTGSSFGDVDIEKVIVFFLESGEDENDPSKHLYQIDLRNGEFRIDDLSFFIGPETELKQGEWRRLLYFRRVAHDNTSKVETGEIVNRQIRRCYHLGFEVLDRFGRTVDKKTIEVGHEVFNL